MNFLFVDRILSDDPGVSITGCKQITADAAYLMPGPDGRAMFFPALIGETLGQLAAWSVMRAADYQLRPVAGIAKKVRFMRPAFVGENLCLTSTITRWDNDAVEYNSVATCRGEEIVTIDYALGPMLPMEDFSKASLVKSQYEKLYRQGEYQANAPMQQALILQHYISRLLVAFDNISDWQPGERARASKGISINAPYFPDHFPEKPVLPLTLLLQMQTNLACDLLSESVDDTQWQVCEFSQIKISEFIQPGDCIDCHITIKKLEAKQAQVVMETYLADKRISISKALFEVTQ